MSDAHPTWNIGEFQSRVIEKLLVIAYHGSGRHRLRSRRALLINARKELIGRGYSDEDADRIIQATKDSYNSRVHV